LRFIPRKEPQKVIELKFEDFSIIIDINDPQNTDKLFISRLDICRLEEMLQIGKI
jgi:hypothetical protein